MDNNIYHWQIGVTSCNQRIYIEFNGTYKYLIHHLRDCYNMDMFDENYQIDFIKRKEVNKMIDARGIIERAVKDYVKENINEESVENCISNSVSYWIDDNDIESAIDLYIEAYDSNFRSVVDDVIQEEVNDYLDRNIDI